VRRYTLRCKMSAGVLKTIENKTTSPTTHFKKLTTGNNVLIVLVIVYAVFISNVQCVLSTFAAGRRTQAGDATYQRRDQ